MIKALLATVLVLGQSAISPGRGTGAPMGATTPTVPIIQSSAFSSDGVFTTSLPSEVVGDLIVVPVSIVASGTPTISNTNGNTWNQSGTTYTNTNVGSYTSIFWTLARATAADTITVTPAVAAYHGTVQAIEYRGPTSGDGSGCGMGSWANPSTGTFTVGHSNDLIVALVTSGGSLSGGYSAGAGYTIRTPVPASGGQLFSEDGIIPGTSVSASATAAYASFQVCAGAYH